MKAVGYSRPELSREIWFRDINLRFLKLQVVLEARRNRILKNSKGGMVLRNTPVQTNFSIDSKIGS